MTYKITVKVYVYNIVQIWLKKLLKHFILSLINYSQAKTTS